jgi:hypothetical protein
VEGVDLDDRKGPVCFRCSYLSTRPGCDPLVSELHGYEDVAAFVESVELGEEGVFDQVGEVVADEASLKR